VNTAIVLGVCIEMFRSIPSGALVGSRVRAGRFRVGDERSYRLQLRPGEAFEIEDPPDQIGLLADPQQAATSEPA
jgi:hypothetical protein